MQDHIPTLKYLCEDMLLVILEKNNFHSRVINDLCKRVPHPLLERVFSCLLERNVITDVALMAFLIPDRAELSMKKTVQIRNATLKQISFNCPKLVCLVLSYFLFSFKFILFVALFRFIRLRSGVQHSGNLYFARLSIIE